MPKMEVFFDYACPYCLTGHDYLVELIGTYPEIEIAWCPCEAHPRPENWHPHSDLCIQAMYYAVDTGVDIWEFHALMYKVALKDKIDLEDVNLLANALGNLIEPEGFIWAVESGKYADKPIKGNKYAFEESGVWAVPSYRMNGHKLDAVENIGVTKEQLGKFMELGK